MANKRFITIFIVLLMAVLTLSGYWYFRNLKSEARWKTYHNNYAEYELLYPGNWLIREIEGSGTVSLLDHENYPDPSPGIFVSTYYYDKADCNESFYEFIKHGAVINAPDLPYTQVKLISIEKVPNVNNTDGYKSTWLYSNQKGDKTTQFNTVNFRNDNCVVATVDKLQGINDSLYNQIISTFKFLNSSETTGWKTYKNNEYGFEFKYPKNYIASDLEIRGPNDLSIFINHFEKGLISSGELITKEEKLSLYDYLNYYYRKTYYENPSTGAYKNAEYKNIMSTDYFESIPSKDENIKIYREHLTKNLEGFESEAYLMDSNRSNTIIMFNWNIISNNHNEIFSQDLLKQFDQVLSTFKFTK